MDEREKIVAWLRAEAAWQQSMRAGQQCAALTLAADRIERGDHDPDSDEFVAIKREVME